MLLRDEFDGRSDVFVVRLRSYWKRLGIFFTDGYFWYTQRRFALRNLRDYGFGRRDKKLEDVIAYEFNEMIDMRINGPKFPAEKDVVKGDLVEIGKFLVIPFINGMHHILTQMTLPRSQYHVLWELSRNSLQFQRSSDDLGGVLSCTPWIKDVIPNLSGYNSLIKSNQCLLDFFTKVLDETLATYDESYCRHFLDVYIKSMKEEQKNNDKTTFSVDQLKLICVDYILPSSTVVQVALTMLVEHMLLQPHIQDKIHEEIDRVVGRDRLPTLDDRQSMPYTEACIRETMRFDTLVPMGVPHRATKDTTIAGYNVPQDTSVAANYLTLHMDKETWGDPENFRPERLIEDGKLVLFKDKSLPFGAGHRLCAGETFSRQSLFQVFAAFMQAFQVSTADGQPLLKPLRRIQGITASMPDLWVRLTPRI